MTRVSIALMVITTYVLKPLRCEYVRENSRAHMIGNSGRETSLNEPYKILGSIDVGTGESSIFLFEGTYYLLDNIFCGYIDHYGQWNATFANHSYARVRELKSGKIVANISETIGTSFVSAFVDSDTKTVWLSALDEDRCVQQCGEGVLAISSKDLIHWTRSTAIAGLYTCNTQVTKVTTKRNFANSSLDANDDNTLPPHKYAMILEPFIFYLNNNADGDLSHGWFEAPNTTTPLMPAGGPSIRWSRGYYYVISGGHHVFLARSKDLRTNWESTLLVQPTIADGTIASLAGFPESASRKGFDTMSGKHWVDWDWNSNDADVCCYNAADEDDATTWIVWGAGTQGAKPKPPAVNSFTNVVATRNIPLADFLENAFSSHN